MKKGLLIMRRTTLFVASLMVLLMVLPSSFYSAQAEENGGTTIYLPVVHTKPFCKEKYQLLSKDAYAKGTSIFEVGKKLSFSPSLIVNLNLTILDETHHIKVEGGTRVCLQKTTKSWIYKNPDQPYQEGDEIGLDNDDVKDRQIDWLSPEDNPLMRLESGQTVQRLFTGIPPSAAAPVAAVGMKVLGRIPQGIVVYEIKAGGNLVDVYGHMNAGFSANFIASRLNELLTVSFDNVDNLSTSEGHHYSPQTSVGEQETIYLWRYGTKFKENFVAIPIDNIVGIWYANDYETTDRGWTLTRQKVNEKGVALTIGQFFSIATIIDDIAEQEITEDDLTKQLEQLLKDIDQNPPPTPDPGGEKCEPIDASVLRSAELYHLSVQIRRPSDFPLSVRQAGKAFLISLQQQAETYYDYYDQMSRGGFYSEGQLYTSTASQGEFLIEAKCLRIPIGLVYRFMSNRGCDGQGGVSSTLHCPSYFKKLPFQGTGSFLYPIR